MKLLQISVLAAAFAGVFLCEAALAGPLADLGMQADQRVDAGDIAGALAVAGDSYSQIWDASPTIGIRDTLLVAEPASGYGLYNPRADNKFKAGEPVFVYAEPYGFGYGSGGDGIYTIGFAVDLRVISSTGEVMGEVNDIANLALTSRYKNREFQANLTYTLNGIPAGNYVLETTLRDQNSSKTGTFQTEVEFTE
ncbi:MAG: hypothetical protein ACOH2M_05745 [Cypionkella sp.]